MIRPATEHDEAECKRLFLAYCAAFYETGDPERFWALHPQEPNGTVLVMDEEGELVGFLSLLIVPMAVAPYQMVVPQIFYVSPTWRGLSWRLMRAGIRYSRERGIHQIALLCSDTLKDFWRAHKFAPSLTMMMRTL